MLSTPARRRVLSLLTDPETADLDDLPLALLADLPPDEVKEVRDEFDALMRYAERSLRHTSDMPPAVWPLAHERLDRN